MIEPPHPSDIYLFLKWSLLKAKFGFDFVQIKFHSFAIIQKTMSHLIDHSNYFTQCFKSSKSHLPHCRVGIRMNVMVAINIMISMKT